VKRQEFVYLWQQAGSVDAVAAALGLSVETVLRLARRLRRGGCHLQRLPRHAPAPPPHVGPRKFIETWKLADTAKEAASLLGLPLLLVLLRADHYRRLGVRLSAKLDESSFARELALGPPLRADEPPDLYKVNSN
jgi:hypothetical protein